MAGPRPRRAARRRTGPDAGGARRGARRGGGGEAAYVADADGSGTTLYTAAYDAFDPRFGAGSAAAHSVSARPIAGELAGLRRDVDDLATLREAWAIGVGPRTHRRAAPLVGDGPSDVDQPSG